MILLHKVYNREIDQNREEFLNTLLSNLSNRIITKIIIFTDSTNVNLLKHNKLLIIEKNGYTDNQIISYVKNISKDPIIIYSSPFSKFNHTLIKISKENIKGKVFTLNSSYNGVLNKNAIDAYIFNIQDGIINEIEFPNSLPGIKINTSLDIKIENKFPNNIGNPYELRGVNDQIIHKSISFDVIKNKRVSVNITDKKITPANILSTRTVSTPTSNITKKHTSVSVDHSSKSVDVISKSKNETKTIVEEIVKREVGTWTPPKVISTDKKLDIIIVSVNYNDLLICSLSENVKIHKNITIVTSPDDLMCQEICKKFNVKYVITDRMYENGAKFNKGKAINEGIKSIEDPQWILHLDADIVLPSNFMDEFKDLEDEYLYMAKRVICKDYHIYKMYKDGGITYEQMGNVEGSNGFGYFQLFNIRNSVLDPNCVYPEISDNAAWSDLLFRDKFIKRKDTTLGVVHLGEAYQNWSGRKTNRFLSDDEFTELMNRPDINLDEAHLKSSIINGYNKPIEPENTNDIEVINISNVGGIKKILFIIYLNDIGGSEYVSYQHIKACKDLGYQPVVLSADKGMFFNKIKDLGVDLYYSKLYDIKKEKIIDILYKVSKGCDIIYNCNYFGITPYISELKKIRDFKYYTIAHSDIEWVINSVSEYDSITDKYLVIHDKIRDELNKKGVCNTRILTIKNYIDYDLINNSFINFNNSDIKSQFGINDSDFIIGMVSRISPDKNILDAIKIISMMGSENIKLLIIGDAPNTTEALPYKNDVISYIKDLNLENNVIITGSVDNSDIYKYISCFNISLNTSPSEGLPISMLEQMSCGVHCIYPSHGDIPEVLLGYGSIINIKQKKSFDPKDTENYIFGRYSDDDLMKYVDEINKVKSHGPIDKSIISDHIKNNRSYESVKHYLDFIYGGHKEGVTFLIRARNEEMNIKKCIESIIDFADEVVMIDHLSTDRTYDISLDLSKKYQNLKVFKYSREVPKAGDNYLKNIITTGNTISNYYNFALSKATKFNIIKWDADFISIGDNVLGMINSHNLRTRTDKFSLWFTGETVFIDSNENYYINRNSKYNEYRSFSLLNGVKWDDAEKCEYIDRAYINDSTSIRYDGKCFYEIKRVDIDEFANRDGVIDYRDIEDSTILNNIRDNKIPINLEKIEKIL